MSLYIIKFKVTVLHVMHAALQRASPKFVIYLFHIFFMVSEVVEQLVDKSGTTSIDGGQNISVVYVIEFLRFACGDDNTNGPICCPC
jgi:hypothetical protein